jgi:two-component system sensor histidine kinase LytS
MAGNNVVVSGRITQLLLYRRWTWHLVFWVGYILFRFWVYYITVTFYNSIFLEYMLLSEVLFVGMTYFTLWLYRRVFEKQKYLAYFLLGTVSWILYLYGRTGFQFFYLAKAPGFDPNSFNDIIFNNLTVVVVFFSFITACKYFKDGFIAQHFEAARKQQQLLAEVNNLKAQIAPHFLFNTLNNLYGLSVEKSDKLPNLMLRLSDLLRHSLYETQKPLVSITEEINVAKSYVDLESIRLEDDLKLKFDNRVPVGAPYQIAPLLLIVFVENAFKHSRLVQLAAVQIEITAMLEGDMFTLNIKNNYNKERKTSSKNGIGLTNVKRRLEVLYPQHQLAINKDDLFFTVNLQVQLEKMV